jgi:hypothetical protein
VVQRARHGQDLLLVTDVARQPDVIQVAKRFEDEPPPIWRDVFAQPAREDGRAA